MEVLIAFIVFFAMVFGIYYMYFKTRNKERLALIEKGADASMFKITSEKGASRNLFNPLKIGLFMIGLGIGAVAGYFAGEVGMHKGASYPSMIFIFGGLGLLVYYLMTSKK
ncbi:MAG TPA: hypothetical protein DEQ09_07515 [Bacteroidales bacterium]|nr:hypothetical protein [Bacteroidales bacterium]